MASYISFPSNNSLAMSLVFGSVLRKIECINSDAIGKHVKGVCLNWNLLNILIVDKEWEHTKFVFSWNVYGRWENDTKNSDFVQKRNGLRFIGGAQWFKSRNFWTKLLSSNNCYLILMLCAKSIFGFIILKQ